MAQKIDMPNGTMYVTRDLTLQEQHDLVDTMTSMCSYSLFNLVKENLLEKDAEFVRFVFKGVKCEVDYQDRMLIWDVDSTVMADAKRAVRKTLDKLVISLPEYKSIVAAEIVAPNQGSIKDIITSKTFELVQAYVLYTQEVASREQAGVPLDHHGFMYRMMGKR